MSRLALYLFGGFRAELDGNPLTSFGTDKNRALLAYLALESDRPHRREALASLLWPARPDPVARNSLRQALYQLVPKTHCYPVALAGCPLSVPTAFAWPPRLVRQRPSHWLLLGAA
jgi:hypothetical protein